MLNCCIERKRLSKIRSVSVEFASNKESLNSTIDSRTTNEIVKTGNKQESQWSPEMERLDSKSSNSDDDEFFEAVESQINSVIEKKTLKENLEKGDNTMGASRESSVGCTRQGTKEPCGDLKLLVSGDQMYVPVTQVRAFFCSAK